ncbi:MAG: hypothetical protein C6W59_06830 [Paenibacillaceae bacterium]|nr:MAG: hypothetical protein C6W59_06830 [Paenibacillaceae bacterium]
MKVNGRKLIMIGLVLIGIAVIGNLVIYAIGVSPFNGVKINEERSVSAEGVSRIDVFSNAGDVRVVSGGDEITVKMTGRTERMHKGEYHLSVSEQGGRVVIEASRDLKRKLISIYPDDYDLLVEIPDRLYEQLGISTEIANISAERVRAQHISMQAVHGDIKTAGLAGRIGARTDTGDIRLGVQAITDDIQAESLLGDIKLVTEEKPEKLALEMKTLIGERKVELPGTAIVESDPGVPTVQLSAEAGDIAVSAGR